MNVDSRDQSITGQHLATKETEAYIANPVFWLNSGSEFDHIPVFEIGSTYRASSCPTRNHLIGFWPIIGMLEKAT